MTILVCEVQKIADNVEQSESVSQLACRQQRLESYEEGEMSRTLFIHLIWGQETVWGPGGDKCCPDSPQCTVGEYRGQPVVMQ